ncbi:Nitrogen fixation protein of unknown function [Lachnospiraceae bacterium JC7]|nr:Nitrogen fixation protein of unknown function [Lachnospiraceae bacterium JC7]
MEIKNFDFSKHDPDLRAKAEKCKSIEEIMELAKSNGIELTDNQLDRLSGGGEDCYYCQDGCPFTGL